MAKQQRANNEVPVGQLSREEEDELAEELYRRRDDPHEWEDKPTELTVDPNFGIVYSVRFTQAEFQEIEQLADRRGVSLDQLIKDALFKTKPTAASKRRRPRRTVRT